jgi:hypothetical protein
MKLGPALALAILMISAAMLWANVAVAQNDAAIGTGAASGTEQAKPAKAQRKAARKQARAKKNAELKRLESAGYQPARNDLNYPDNLQKAQKKAGIGTGASQ